MDQVDQWEVFPLHLPHLVEHSPIKVVKERDEMECKVSEEREMDTLMEMREMIVQYLIVVGWGGEKGWGMRLNLYSFLMQVVSRVERERNEI